MERNVRGRTFLSFYQIYSPSKTVSRTVKVQKEELNKLLVQVSQLLILLKACVRKQFLPQGPFISTRRSLSCKNGNLAPSTISKEQETIRALRQKNISIHGFGVGSLINGLAQQRSQRFRFFRTRITLKKYEKRRC